MIEKNIYNKNVIDKVIANMEDKYLDKSIYKIC